MAFSANTAYLLCGTSHHKYFLWNLQTGKCEHTFTKSGENQKFTPVLLNQNGKLALLLNRWLFDVKSQKCLQQYQNYNSDASPNGQFVLLNKYTNVALLDLPTNNEVRHFEGDNMVNATGFSADGQMIFSCGKDQTIRLWKISTGQCLQKFEGHTDEVEALALSVDASFAVSASKDKTLRIWDVNSGQCLKILQGHAGEVTSVFLSPDGRFVLSGSSDHTLRLWELDWDWTAMEVVDWDNRIQIYLENFIRLQTPYVSIKPDSTDFLQRQGRPEWTQADWLRLLKLLQYAGYGWVRREGVQKTLDALSKR